MKLIKTTAGKWLHVLIAVSYAVICIGVRFNGPAKRGKRSPIYYGVLNPRHFVISVSPGFKEAYRNIKRPHLFESFIYEIRGDLIFFNLARR